MTPLPSTAEILVPAPGFRRYAPGDALDFGAPFVWTVDGVLEAEARQDLITRIERLGPEQAPITTASGFVMDSSVRNNTRSIFDDPNLSFALFEQLRPFLPDRMCADFRPVGANERWRCYRYDPGQYFAPHYDGAFVRNANEESQLTLILYLNEDFEGGETAFPELGVSVRPKAGQALLFQHRLLHESTPVRRGRKYAARSDIMYRRT